MTLAVDRAFVQFPQTASSIKTRFPHISSISTNPPKPPPLSLSHALSLSLSPSSPTTHCFFLALWALFHFFPSGWNLRRDAKGALPGAVCLRAPPCCRTARAGNVRIAYSGTPLPTDLVWSVGLRRRLRSRKPWPRPGRAPGAHDRDHLCPAQRGMRWAGRRLLFGCDAAGLPVPLPRLRGGAGGEGVL
jgi:hypothetical protein